MKLKKIEQGMVIHCNIEEEAKELIKWAYECGFKWLMINKNFTDTHWDANQGHGIYYDFGHFHFCDDIITYQNTKMSDNIVEFSDLVIPEPKFKAGDFVKDYASNRFWVVSNSDYSEMDDTYYYYLVSYYEKNTFITLREDKITQKNLSQVIEEELTAEEAIKFMGEMCCECGGLFKCIFRQKYSEKISISCNEWKKTYPDEVIESLKQYKKDHTTLPPKEPETEWVYECYNLDEGEHHHSIIYEKEEDAMEYCRLWTIGKGSNLGYTYRKVCRVKE